jgi:hypothetical protein
LVDTQANGTAIMYNIGESARGILHPYQEDSVQMPEGYALGTHATDQMCLD